MSLSHGYRFEATQAVRQVLNRAVVWGMLDINPAKVGVDNPTPRRKEQHPFETWAELETLATALGARYGPPRPPNCGPRSGSRSSGVTSIGTNASHRSAGPTPVANSSCRRPRAACAP